jgi:hypothetical protein
MKPSRRSLRAAALLPFFIAAAAATAALAQETSNTVGPPVLKDFQLPGQRTTPPAEPANPPQRTTPPPVRTEQPAPAPAERAAERRPQPTARAAERPPPRAQTPPAAVPQAPANQSSEPLGAPPAAELPLPAPAEPAPQPAAEAPPAAEPASGSWFPYLAGAAVLALLGWFALRLRRQRRTQVSEETRTAAREELGEALFAKWQPAAEADATPDPALAPPGGPNPAPSPEPEPTQPRAWLETEIKAERAAATDTDATVYYALTLRNRGEAEARNIRIDPRLCNASAEAEMLAFFQGPIHEQSGSPHVTIAPGGHLTLMGQVSMPMSDVREIELAGRRIFVPMVAINVAYDWEGGTGRTSRSWLVGREPATPSAKMGPFRLDLGPRVYRQVAQREARAVMV